MTVTKCPTLCGHLWAGLSAWLAVRVHVPQSVRARGGQTCVSHCGQALLHETAKPQMPSPPALCGHLLSPPTRPRRPSEGSQSTSDDFQNQEQGTKT